MPPAVSLSLSLSLSLSFPLCLLVARARRGASNTGMPCRRVGARAGVAVADVWFDGVASVARARAQVACVDARAIPQVRLPGAPPNVAVLVVAFEFASADDLMRVALIASHLSGKRKRSASPFVFRVSGNHELWMAPRLFLLRSGGDSAVGSA